MLCPDCDRRYKGAAGECPYCGRAKGVVRTSTILISSGERQAVYRSVDEMPEALKRQLIRSTSGLNSQTIVIADRQGRKEIVKAIAGLPAPESAQPVSAPHCAWLAGLTVARAAGVFTLVAAAAIVWLIFR